MSEEFPDMHNRGATGELDRLKRHPLKEIFDHPEMKTIDKKWFPDKRILWFVLKKHKNRIWMNANRIVDLCFTWHGETFSFFCEGTLHMIICCYHDIALNTTPKGLTPQEHRTAGRPPALTEVWIELVDQDEEIKPEPYPEIDVMIVDRGQRCEMIKNNFGELKKFLWPQRRIKTGKVLCFSDFIIQKN